MEISAYKSETSVDTTATAIQNVTENQDSTSSAAESDFATYMAKALGGDGKNVVNEEELFAALIQQRLEKENPEGAAFFKEEFDRLSVSMARSDGYVPVEDVAKAALKSAVDGGKIESAKAEQIHGEAFAAAQLDANTDVLFDGRGSASDPTVATAELEAALRAMEELVTKIESGEVTIAARSLDTPSNAAPSAGSGSGGLESLTPSGVAPTGPQDLDGSDGFLWKPESERDGKLVVLLPENFTGNVERVEIHSALPATEESKIASGQFTSVANGNRAHFRFGESGGDYPDGSYVVAYLDSGESASWQIGDTSARND